MSTLIKFKQRFIILQFKFAKARIRQLTSCYEYFWFLESTDICDGSVNFQVKVLVT
jgi:hypothetical protein